MFPAELARHTATRESDALSGARKAAVLCIALGDDAVGNIFKYLSEAEVQLISKELAAIEHVKSSVADEVIEEFHQLVLAKTYVTAGGIDHARRLLTKIYGPELAKRQLDKITRSLESTVGFEALQKLDPQQLTKLFMNEHPQTIALVLSHLDASTAADAMQQLPEALRADITLRMASLQPISRDVIRRVSVVLDEKLKSVGDLNRGRVGGVHSVAELCNRLDREVSRKLLDDIEATDPDLALSIRNLMVTFDDLLLVDDVGVREILQRVDKKSLTLALKGTIPELQERVFSNMSSRAVEMMQEEMEYMGQVKMKDVSKAQRIIVEIMRELDEKGIISLSAGVTGESEYVS